jgi:hypothetical protein
MSAMTPTAVQEPEQRSVANAAEVLGANGRSRPRLICQKSPAARCSERLRVVLRDCASAPSRRGAISTLLAATPHCRAVMIAFTDVRRSPQQAADQQIRAVPRQERT